MSVYLLTYLLAYHSLSSDFSGQLVVNEMEDDDDDDGNGGSGSGAQDDDGGGSCSSAAYDNEHSLR